VDEEEMAVVEIEEDGGTIADAVPVPVPRAGALPPTRAVVATDADEVRVEAGAEADRSPSTTRNLNGNVLVHRPVRDPDPARTANNAAEKTKEARTYFSVYDLQWEVRGRFVGLRVHAFLSMGLNFDICLSTSFFIGGV